jgi:tetratricopeptide (TPR) repeat protein
LRIVPLCTALGAAVLVSLCAPVVTRAADAPAQAAPSDEELDAAKEHFVKGKELYEKGDKKGAVDEFKLAYKLSKNAILLYNVALVYDELGEKAKALHYYEKFVKEAPDSDKTKENKKTSTGRVAVLTKELAADDDEEIKPAATAPAPAATPAPAPAPAEPAKKVVTAFTHATLDEAPPAKPIDVTALVPDGVDWKLSLYYRTAGKDEFTAVKMKPRFQELVGRIPADVVKGASLQYYIEVKDAAGKLVAQSGSPASPNIVYLEAKAKSHFYREAGDPEETVEEVVAKPDPKANEASEGLDDEDPLGEGTGVRGQLDSDIDLGGSSEDEPGRAIVGDGSGQPTDNGNKVKWAKWGTTGGAAVLLGTSIVLYMSAASYADKLESDTNRVCTPMPCQFDDYSADLQSTGQTMETWSKITFGAGLVTAGVAGYFWYRELVLDKRGTGVRAAQTPAGKSDDEASSGVRFLAAPMIGDGVVGGAAVVTF